jgi:hypothetical protein
MREKLDLSGFVLICHVSTPDCVDYCVDKLSQLCVVLVK